MFIFYVICGALIFAGSSLVMQLNRLAIYRRRIIRHLANPTQAKKTQLKKQQPYVLSEQQEQKIKQCFSKGMPIRECIDML